MRLKEYGQNLKVLTYGYPPLCGLKIFLIFTYRNLWVIRHMRGLKKVLALYSLTSKVIRHMRGLKSKRYALCIQIDVIRHMRGLKKKVENQPEKQLGIRYICGLNTSLKNIFLLHYYSVYVILKM